MNSTTNEAHNICSLYACNNAIAQQQQQQTISLTNNTFHISSFASVLVFRVQYSLVYWKLRLHLFSYCDSSIFLMYLDVPFFCRCIRYAIFIHFLCLFADGSCYQFFLEYIFRLALPLLCRAKDMQLTYAGILPNKA